MRNEASIPLPPCIETYRNREAAFVYRSRTYNFSLSHGLFSSADVDAGSRFLLKIFSNFLDRQGPASSRFFGAGLFGRETPIKVLDAGSGTGVLGICAAGAISDSAARQGAGDGELHLESASGIPSVLCRAQDRDDLARLFTEHNARRNGLSEEIFSSHTEPLLAGPELWDLILTNIPAKAGAPVLEDFIRRSAGLLKKDGLVFLVAVAPLADFFRTHIKASAGLVYEEAGKGHTVFVYGRKPGVPEPAVCPIIFDENFPGSYPFYIRNQSEYEMEGISYRLDTLYGAPDFDSPGGVIQAAAKLSVKINLAEKLKPGSVLIHDEGQGHFGLWLAHYLKVAAPGTACASYNSGGSCASNRSVEYRQVLSGRNILALGAAKAALSHAGISSAIFPSVELYPEWKHLSANAGGFALIAFFPEAVPECDRREADWKALPALAAPGGLVIAGMSSMEADRFDRKKPPAFSRLGDIRRKGFRAMAYVSS